MKRNKTSRKAGGGGVSPYRKYEKKPFGYKDEIRLAGGDLKNKANDRLSNKYA